MIVKQKQIKQWQMANATYRQILFANCCCTFSLLPLPRPAVRSCVPHPNQVDSPRDSLRLQLGELAINPIEVAELAQLSHVECFVILPHSLFQHKSYQKIHLNGLLPHTHTQIEREQLTLWGCGFKSLVAPEKRIESILKTYIYINLQLIESHLSLSLFLQANSRNSPHRILHGCLY